MSALLPAPARVRPSRRTERIRRFARLYARSWTGVAGLVIVLFFAVLGAAAPHLSPYHPIHDRDLATPMARPAWMAAFPAYRRQPVTRDLRLPAEAWEIVAASNVSWLGTDPEGGRGLEVRPLGPGEASVELRYTLDYPYEPPPRFVIQLPVEWIGGSDGEGEVRIGFLTADERRLELWSAPLRTGSSYADPPIRVDSLQRTVLPARLGLSFFDNVAEHVFSTPGTYRLFVELTLAGEDAAVRVGEGRFRIPGALHGWLGVDGLGRDLWSQFIHGARISLWVGLAASALATLVGAMIGIVSGYFGGRVDELLMRFTDVMLSVPFLPVLMILTAMLGQATWTLVVLLGLSAWMGTARLVRTATLSLRTRGFVDAARTAGAGHGYIMRVHILPHVSGPIITSLVLLMPTAIIAEATLSFLGFGDPNLPTWGRMLYTARSEAAFSTGAWWAILPPGAGMTALSLALVWIGHRLDDLIHRREQEV